MDEAVISVVARQVAASKITSKVHHRRSLREEGGLDQGVDLFYLWEDQLVVDHLELLLFFAEVLGQLGNQLLFGWRVYVQPSAVSNQIIVFCYVMLKLFSLFVVLQDKKDHIFLWYSVSDDIWHSSPCIPNGWAIFYLPYSLQQKTQQFRISSHPAGYPIDNALI